MAYSVLRDLFDARPFRPVELTTSDGRTFRVTHPENLLLTKTLLVVRKGEESVELLSLLHIVSANTGEAEAA